MPENLQDKDGALKERILTDKPAIVIKKLPIQRSPIRNQAGEEQDDKNNPVLCGQI